MEGGGGAEEDQRACQDCRKLYPADPHSHTDHYVLLNSRSSLESPLVSIYLPPPHAASPPAHP